MTKDKAISDLRIAAVMADREAQAQFYRDVATLIEQQAKRIEELEESCKAAFSSTATESLRALCSVTDGTDKIRKLKAENAELRKAHKTVKDWGHRVEQRLSAILSRCEEHQVGSEDASSEEKAVSAFADNLIGYSNELMLRNLDAATQSQVGEE